MNLREYQVDVIKKMMWAKDLEGNDIVCVAQGGGKSIIIAEFIHRIGKSILILCPSKEILEQNVAKMQHYVGKEEVGIYSASMGEKTIKKITFGTIQSIYKKPELFEHFEIVGVDECDLVSIKKMGSMYMKFFKAIGNPKVFGFTGTPYRQDVFYIYPEGYRGQIWQKKEIEAVTTTKMINRYKERFWKRMLCAINTQELMDLGFLCPIEYHDMSKFDHSQIPTNISKSEFDMVKFEEMLSTAHGQLANTISKLPHKAKLVFCSSIEQAERLSGLTPDSMVVTSKTTKKKRAIAVKELRDGTLKILYNVGIFTVGFDYPELDCIVLLRPTRSLRLHSQVLGRVTRIAEGKTVGHVYDFVGNIKGMGKLEEIVVKKTPAFFRGKSYQAWNVVSPAKPKGFHMASLYKYKIERKK